MYDGPAENAVTAGAPPHRPAHDPAVRRPLASRSELAIVALIIVADQLTKLAVRANIPLGDSVTVIPGLLDLTYVQNTGAAFGLLNNVDFAYKPIVMIGMAFLALLAISAYATQLGFQDRLARLGLAIIVGGAFGNLTDRVFVGHVVDFVDLHWNGVHFWAFNVADAAINVGALLVILDTFGIGRRHAPNPV